MLKCIVTVLILSAIGFAQQFEPYKSIKNKNTCYFKGGCLLTGYASLSLNQSSLNNISNLWLMADVGSIFTFKSRQSSLGFGIGGSVLLNYDWGKKYDFIPFKLGHDRIFSDDSTHGILQAQYIGGFLEWLLAPLEKVHGGIKLFIGVGQLGIRNQESSLINIYVLQPEWSFQYNINHWSQLFLGIHFRYFGDDFFGLFESQLDNIDQHLTSFFDRSQLGFRLGIKFGWFDVEPKVPEDAGWGSAILKK